jgi:mannonate dehydratase
MSAIDGALWDIMGKRAGMPVHDLMGGKVREGCRMFANASGHCPNLLELFDFTNEWIFGEL